MINPDEYIKRFRRINADFTFEQDEIIFASIAKDICTAEGIQFRDIYSSFVFPQCVKLGNEHLIIWDNCYWDFVFVYCQCVELLCVDKSYADFCKPYFIWHIYKFLSLRLEKYPYISLALAKEAVAWEAAFKDILEASEKNIQDYLIESKSKLKTKSIINKLYVFFHEHMHFIYATKGFEGTDKIAMVELCKRMKDSIAGAEIDEIIRTTIESLAEGNDLRALEEVSCDYRSIMEATQFWHSLIKSELPISKTFRQVISHVNHIRDFNNIVNQIEQTWQAHSAIFNDLLPEKDKRNLIQSAGEIADKLRARDEAMLQVYDEHIKKWTQESDVKFDKMKKRDESVSQARNEFLILACYFAPHIIVEQPLEDLRDICDEITYNFKKYGDFFNSIHSSVCNLEKLMPVFIESHAIEFALQYTPARALEKRDELLGWKIRNC